MKRLLLLRHAKSSWSDESLADHDRPLAPRGRRDAKRLAKELSARGERIDFVLCSSATRAMETWAELARRLDPPPQVRFTRELYLPSVEALLGLLAGTSASVGTLLVVGHSPSLDALILRLVRGPAGALRARVAEKLPTCALAELSLRGSSFAALGRARCQLSSLWVPNDSTTEQVAPAAPVKASPVELGAKATQLEAARAALASCLEQLRGNLEGARRNEDAEYVHQLRVGVRRLRVALRMFRSLLEPSEHEALSEELRWLFRQLGPVRDYDVFLETVIDPLVRSHPTGALRRLRRHMLEERAHAAEQAASSVTSARCAALIQRSLALEAALAGQADETKRVRRWAKQRLKRRLRKVRALEPAIRVSDVLALHELRKQLKKLRYGAEFVGSAFPASSRRYLKRITALQHELGALNDVASGERLLKQALAALPVRREHVAVREQVQQVFDASVVSTRERLERAFDQFVAAEPFWR